MKPVVERSGTFRIWMRKKNAACTPAGVQELLVVSSSGGVVARAPQPPATGFNASGIFFDQNMSFMTEISINIFLRSNNSMSSPSGDRSTRMMGIAPPQARLRQARSSIII